MKKIAMFLGIALLATTASAQNINPEKGAPSPESVVRGGNIAIPDDGYDGTLGSMACVTQTVPEGEVEDVSLDLAVNHTWIGDLVVKVQSPMGTTVTVQSRAGYAEPADDGTGCCGDSSNLVETSPLAYSDGGVTSAEDMGNTILDAGVACQDDGFCDYFGVPDSGPGVGFADFIGEEGAGDWSICVGDSVGADTGDINPGGTVLNITQAAPPPAIEIPTANRVGLGLLVALLGLGAVVLLRRR